MSEDFEIKNKVAQSGLENFDISTLVPKGERKGIDLKDFLYEELILREKDFRQKVDELNLEEFKDSFIYIYNSVDAIVPLWAYFLITSKLSPVAQKVVYGTREDLETILLHDAIEKEDFNNLIDKRVLIKGCSDQLIPENAYVELVQKLQPKVRSLMFGEACSNVPIFKRKS